MRAALNGSGGAFSLTGVDITNQTLGLVGTLEDKRTGAARVWVKTGTGMGTAAFIQGVKASKTPRAGQLLALGKNGKFPTSVVPAGPRGEPAMP